MIDWSRTNRGRVFKNPEGQAWVGKTLQTDKKDAILIQYPRKITFGLKIGSSDLIGWEYSLHDGFTFPIFCSIEIKTLASPTVTDYQILWLNNMLRIGGRAYLAMETAYGYDLKFWEFRE